MRPSGVLLKSTKHIKTKKKKKKSFPEITFLVVVVVVLKRKNNSGLDVTLRGWVWPYFSVSFCFRLLLYFCFQPFQNPIS